MAYTNKHSHAKTLAAPPSVVVQESGGSVRPLVQTGLKRAAEAYLDLPPNAADHFYSQQQQTYQKQHAALISTAEQHQNTSVPLDARSESSIGQFECKHGYQVFILSRDPMVLYFEDFLQPGEAEHIIELAKPIMGRSRVIGPDEYSEDRTTSQDDIVKCIEERASQITNISVENTESLQVVWYTKGQEFRPHHDYLYPEEFGDANNSKWLKTGQRYTTFLVYLNEPTEGGGTLFTELDFEVMPKKNGAVFWYNVDHNEAEDERTMHGGSPVEDGEKYAINIWQRKMLPYIQSYKQDSHIEEQTGNYNDEKYPSSVEMRE
ncbi:hypothetical protein BDF19DRAFT_429975 [Syncephalis fuscata]|nr:hypothetical protein BDF19DRAFT_429975 [Syncephalis fuscata]